MKRISPDKNHQTAGMNKIFFAKVLLSVYIEDPGEIDILKKAMQYVISSRAFKNHDFIKPADITFNVLLMYLALVYQHFLFDDESEVLFIKYIESPGSLHDLIESLDNIVMILQEVIDLYNEVYPGQDLSPSNELYFHLTEYFSSLEFHIFPDTGGSKADHASSEIKDMILAQSKKINKQDLSAYLISQKYKLKQKKNAEFSERDFYNTILLDSFLREDLTVDESRAFINYYINNNKHKDFNLVYNTNFSLNTIKTLYDQAYKKWLMKLRFETFLFNPFMSDQLQRKVKKTAETITDNKILFQTIITFDIPQDAKDEILTFYDCISRFNNDSDELINVLLLYYIFEIDPCDLKLTFFTDESVNKVSIFWAEYVDYYFIIREGFMLSDQTRVKIFLGMKNYSDINKSYLVFLKNVYDLKAREKHSKKKKNPAVLSSRLEEKDQLFYQEIRSSNGKDLSEVNLERVYRPRQKKKINVIAGMLIDRRYSPSLLYFMSMGFFKDAAIETECLTISPVIISSFFTSSLGFNATQTVYDAENNEYLNFISQNLELK